MYTINDCFRLTNTYVYTKEKQSCYKASIGYFKSKKRKGAIDWITKGGEKRTFFNSSLEVWLAECSNIVDCMQFYQTTNIHCCQMAQNASINHYCSSSANDGVCWNDQIYLRKKNLFKYLKWVDRHFFHSLKHMEFCLQTKMRDAYQWLQWNAHELVWFA